MSAFQRHNAFALLVKGRGSILIRSDGVFQSTINMMMKTRLPTSTVEAINHMFLNQVINSEKDDEDVPTSTSSTVQAIDHLFLMLTNVREETNEISGFTLV